MSKTREKIAIIGGHFTPAFSVLEEVLDQGKYEPIWIGVKKTRLFASGMSLEYSSVTSKGVKFYSLISGKLSRYWKGKEFFKSLIYLARIPIGIIQATVILIKERPKYILGFGGYTSVAVVVASFFTKTPFFLHEQILQTSLASKICFPFAKLLFVSYPPELMDIPKRFQKKIVFSGWPLRKDLIKVAKMPVQKLGPKKKTVFITGGNQGSAFINSLIEQNIDRLLQNFQIIHQTGETISSNAKLLKVAKDGSSYKFSKYFSSSEMAQNLKGADVVISRGGASTVYELMFLRKKSIIIPLPGSANGGEQLQNARFLEGLGLAKVLLEDDLEKDPALLIKTLNDVLNSEIVINEKKYPKIDFENSQKRILEKIDEFFGKKS